VGASDLGLSVGHLKSEMGKDDILPQSECGYKKKKCNILVQKKTQNTLIEVSNTLSMVQNPFVYLFGRLFVRFNAFCRNYLIFLFKSSAIYKIFRIPGSPRSALFPCLLVIFQEKKTINQILLQAESLNKKKQRSRKLVPLVPPIPDKPYLVGQNEI
jgi:hypothetical protein